jgi:hypothetical protein
VQSLSVPSIAAYCAFGIFVFYQQLHAKNFRGASQSLAVALNVSALLGMATGVAYLVYYGWTVVWWAPIVAFVVGLMGTILGALIERATGALALSLFGFVGWPLSAYFMFRYLP